MVIATVASAEPSDADLDEMRELLRTARVKTVGTMMQRRARPTPHLSGQRQAGRAEASTPTVSAPR